MNDSGSYTHRPRAVDPMKFRQMATGIGQTQAASCATGAMRAACVAAKMPAKAAAAAPEAEGFMKPPPPVDFVDSEYPPDSTF